MTITIESRGRRHYLVGNTFAIKDRLRAAGFHFDGDNRAWWTSKRELTESLAGSAPAVQPRDDARGLDTDVIGRAEYKGRSYYVIWEGQTQRGYAAKLVFRDGSKTFWANGGEYQITKRYQNKKTIKDLQEYAQAAREGRDLAEEKAIRTNRCRECGGPLVNAKRHAAMDGYCGNCAFDEFDC